MENRFSVLISGPEEAGKQSTGLILLGWMDSVSCSKDRRTLQVCTRF